MSEPVRVPRVTAPLESLEKASKGLPLSGIALFVAQLMFEEAETVTSGARVYFGGSRKALMSLFPTKDGDRADSVAAAVRPYLYKNGFKNRPGGGYLVPSSAPDAGSWQEPEAVSGNARVQAESALAEEKAKVLAGDVRRTFACRYCQARFTTQVGRGGHEKAHPQVWRAPDAKEVTVSGSQYLLLKTIAEKPWEHPSWYAKHLKMTPGSITQAARVLRQMGLVTSTGRNQSTRYGVTSIPEGDLDAPERETPAPVLKHRARPKAPVEDWRDTSRYLSAEAASALIEQVDKRLEEAAALSREAENIKDALLSLVRRT